MNPAQATQHEPDMLDALRQPVEELLKLHVDEDLLAEKQRQNFRLTKANNYNRGNTWIAPEVNGTTGAMSWTGVSTGSSSERDLESAGLYDYHIDITRSYGRKYTAVLGTRPFYNMKGKPENPQSEEDRDAARQAELAAQFLRSKWAIRIRNIEVFAKQWESGNVYGYLNFAADEKLWGTYEEPEYESRTVEVEPGGYRCPQCGAKFDQPAVAEAFDDLGVPVQSSSCPECGSEVSDIHIEEPQTADVPELVGMVPYPHAGPKLTLTTGFTVTLPFDVTDFDECPALLYEYEAQKGSLLAYFGDDLRKHLSEDGQELKSGGSQGSIHEQGAQARGGAASLSGTRSANKHRWAFSRYWIMPSMYEMAKEESVREMLKQQYPDGLKVSQVEGITVRLENEALTDVWFCFTPEPGEYLYRDPMCWGILPLQDITNDTWNLLIATIERGMPTNVMDPSVIDDDKLRDRSRMLEVIWSKPNPGRRLEDAIATIPSANFPKGADMLLAGVEEKVQQHTGLLPAAWGGQSGNKTAEQARADLNQSLMQLAVPGEYAVAGWTACFTKAVRLMAKYGQKAMQWGGEMLDFEVLRAGKWYFEGDPGVPMSWTEVKQTIELIIGQNPALAHAMGMDAPINTPVMRDYLLPGLNEMRVPGEDDRDRILDRVRTLLEQEPIAGPMGEMQSSIPPDPLLDDPIADGDLLRQWLNGPQGRQEETTRPRGYANVKLHLAAMRQMAMEMAPPPPPDGAADGPPPPKPKGSGGPPPPPPPTQQTVLSPQ